MVRTFTGHHRDKDFRPARLTPSHYWAQIQGAVFVETGPWLRAQYFPRAGERDWLEAVSREVRTVRSAVGFCDVSTLGKIDLQGPDAAIFLDRLYINTFSTVAVGRARYGAMLREDGPSVRDALIADQDIEIVPERLGELGLRVHQIHDAQVGREARDIGLEHLAGETAGILVVARAVIAIDQDAAVGQAMFGEMPELVVGEAAAGGAHRRLMGDLAEGDQHARVAQAIEREAVVGPAGRNLLRQRHVAKSANTARQPVQRTPKLGHLLERRGRVRVRLEDRRELRDRPVP